MRYAVRPLAVNFITLGLFLYVIYRLGHAAISNGDVVICSVQFLLGIMSGRIILHQLSLMYDLEYEQIDLYKSVVSMVVIAMFVIFDANNSKVYIGLVSVVSAMYLFGVSVVNFSFVRK